MGLNLGNMIFRIVQRMRAVRRVNGFSQAMMVPVRWLLANVVNVAASYKAHTNYRRSVRTGESPKWVKTQHQLPAHFTQEIVAEVSTS
ncbi:bacteriophage N4 adsorption protein B [compost metagenome]